MNGKYHIDFGAADFVRGMSSSAHIADGGFSPETLAVNLTATRGVLYAPALAVDCSTNLSSSAIAWCPNNLGTNGFLLSDNGTIHSISTSQVLTAAASALTGTWTSGKSDIVQFIDKIYATSDTDVARMDTNLTNGDHDWWSATQSEGVLTAGVPHPLCIFQDRLWVADANALHKIIDSSNTDPDVLVLSTHHVITALAVDPSSGKMLIATSQDTTAGNYSATLAKQSSIFSYDGTSATYTREYSVDGIVTGFHTVGGTVFVAYGGTNIGYWNGAGVTYLRTLKNVTLAGADLPYKHHMAHIDSTLYVVDGKQVLAFGDILSGQKAWYYCYNNQVNSNKHSLICPVGSKLLGLGFATTKFYSFDTSSVASTGGLELYSNRYTFPRPIFLRSFYVEYADSVAAGEDNRLLYYLTDDSGNLEQLGTSALKNNSASSVRVIEDVIGAANDKTRYLQLYYNSSSNNYGLRRIIVYYDVAE